MLLKICFLFKGHTLLKVWYLDYLKLNLKGICSHSSLVLKTAKNFLTYFFLFLLQVPFLFQSIAELLHVNGKLRS